MSVYLTEAEQMELIKKGWQRYGAAVMWGLSIVLLAMSAWKYWHWHQEKVLQQASARYEQLMTAVATQEDKQIQSYARSLITEHKKTVYATAALLTLAKQAVDSADYQAARTFLTTAIATSRHQPFTDIAKLRLARLWMADHAYQKALDVLSTVDEAMYGPRLNELRGDIQLALHATEKAKQAYQRAITQCEAHGMSHGLLDYKLSSITPV